MTDTTPLRTTFRRHLVSGSAQGFGVNWYLPGSESPAVSLDCTWVPESDRPRRAWLRPHTPAYCTVEEATMLADALTQAADVGRRFWDGELSPDEALRRYGQGEETP